MMLTYLVSSTDQDLCALLDGISSRMPEEYGADVLAFTRSGLAAWQRKTVEDLLNSLEGGSEKDGKGERLVRELPLLASKVKYPVLIAEGRPMFDRRSGNLIRGGRPSRWSKQAYRNLLRSVKYQFGVVVEETESIQDTADAIREMTAWLMKTEHLSLLRRPKPTDGWGCPLKGMALYEYILQGFPHMGPKTARAILAHFDNKIPLGWTCSEKQMRGVDGIGKVIAEGLGGVIPFRIKEVVSGEDSM